jgi:hypothetical protein
MIFDLDLQFKVKLWPKLTNIAKSLKIFSRTVSPRGELKAV